MLRRVVSVDGQVAYDESPRLGAGDGGHVVEHVVERDVRGVRKTEDHHAERVADEQDVHAAFVQQAGGRVVVCGEDRDRAFAFAGPDGFCFLESGHFGEMKVREVRIAKSPRRAEACLNGDP